MSDKISCVILAAGEGRRLGLNVPKPLAPALGKALIDFPIRAVCNFSKNHKLGLNITAVVGHGRELVTEHISQYDEVNTVVQQKQLGTGDAVKSYFKGFKDADSYEYTMIICADTPLIRESQITQIFEELTSKQLDAVAATFRLTKPTGYGRIIPDKVKGFHIVEEKDADEQTKEVNLVNAGLYIFKTSYMTEHLNSLNSNNKAGEFYLTDLFESGRNVSFVEFDNSTAFLGVNTPEQLENVAHLLKKEKIAGLRANGVRFIDSRHCYVDDDVEVEAGTVIHPNTYLYGKTKIGKDSIISVGSVLTNAIVGNGCELKPYSVINESKLADGVAIGPFAHLRPGADIGAESKIGNFVEIKKSKLHTGVKVSHLSYVGDAEIGDETNIGCGFITCNYDGAKKHKTTIGKGCFIGSDSQMIAPVTIGNEAYVASGSTINQDIPDGGFGIARGRQTTKEGMAKRFIKKK